MPSIAVPNEILIPEIKTLLDEGHTATLRVHGVSMRPFVEGGRDVVLLAPCTDTQTLKKGDVVLAKTLQGPYVLHRITAIRDKMFTLRGDGNVYGTETCTEEGIVAIATGFLRKGEEEPDLTTDRKWRIYSALWPSAFWPRRLLLALYRRVWLRLFSVK